MRKIKIVLSGTFIFGLLWTSQTVLANDNHSGQIIQGATTQYAPNYIGMFVAEDFHDHLANATLGYEKGKSLSFVSGRDYILPFTYSWQWDNKDPAPFDMYHWGLGRNANGDGNVIIKKNIDANSPDGTLSINYNQSNRTWTIKRVKDAPTNAQQSFNIPALFQYTRMHAYYDDGTLDPFTRQLVVKRHEYDITIPDTEHSLLNNNNPLNLYDYVTLEEPPALVAEPDKASFELPDTIPATPEQYVNVKQHMNNSTVTYTWKTKPDINSHKSQTAVATVTDTLGNYVHTQTVNLTFTQKISADPVSQNERLGTDIAKIDYSKFVTNVRLGDQLLSSDQYKVELIGSLATDNIGIKNAKIRVTLKSDTSKTIDLDVPVEVSWGDSIVYGCYDYYGIDRTAGAFTLYTGTTPTIVASQGKGDDNLAIHSNFPNQQYYTFNWFDFSNEQSLKMDESSDGDRYIKANGDELKKDKLKEWGTNQRQDVHYGDVVRAWQTETEKNWIYENEQKRTYNEGKESVYYEITTSGYRLLHFNQLSTKGTNIPVYNTCTKQYLDEHAKDYIDVKNYSNISVKGFSEYPNTTSPGEKKAKILVEEALTTGKKVQYEYEVMITVKKDKTQLDLQDVNLYVGQNFDIDSVFKKVTDKDGNPIKASNVEWYYIDEAKTKTLDTSKPGKHKVRIVYLNAANEWKYSDSCTITVKDDKSSIQTKNTTLQIGQTWDKESNFVSATDEDGNSIPWSDSRITSNGASVDTSKVGVMKLKYTYKGKVKNTDSEFTVTVEDPLKLIVPSNSDFGTYKLGSSNSVLKWNKSSKVEVEGANSSQWDLSVALSAKSSLKGYIKLGDQTISEQPQEVISGTGPMDVTGDVPSDNFIKVDYTGVKQLRKDTGNLEWTLTPSTKEVSE